MPSSLVLPSESATVNAQELLVERMRISDYSSIELIQNQKPHKCFRHKLRMGFKGQLRPSLQAGARALIWKAERMQWIRSLKRRNEANWEDPSKSQDSRLTYANKQACGVSKGPTTSLIKVWMLTQTSRVWRKRLAGKLSIQKDKFCAHMGVSLNNHTLTAPSGFDIYKSLWNIIFFL